MERVVAFCGMICNECPAFIATQKDDNEERKKVAELWSKMFNMEIKPEDINCDGCVTTTGKLIDYCRICEVRNCGVEKGVKNCAYCDEYICDKLNEWFKKIAPNAKATLEEVKLKKYDGPDSRSLGFRKNQRARRKTSLRGCSKKGA